MKCTPLIRFTWEKIMCLRYHYFFSVRLSRRWEEEEFCDKNWYRQMKPKSIIKVQISCFQHRLHHTHTLPYLRVWNPCVTAVGIAHTSCNTICTLSIQSASDYFDCANVQLLFRFKRVFITETPAMACRVRAFNSWPIPVRTQLTLHVDVVFTDIDCYIGYTT